MCLNHFVNYYRWTIQNLVSKEETQETLQKKTRSALAFSDVRAVIYIVVTTTSHEVYITMEAFSNDPCWFLKEVEWLDRSAAV